MMKFLFGWLRPAPLRPLAVSAEKSNELYHALQELGTGSTLAGEITDLVEAWAAGEDLSTTIARILAERAE